MFCKENGEKFTGDHFSKLFKKACKAAGMYKAIHFHSLRHSFASNLAQQGVSLYLIKELLGHSSITTTEIYSHLNMEALKEAIDKLNGPMPSPRQGAGKHKYSSSDRAGIFGLVSNGTFSNDNKTIIKQIGEINGL